MAQGAIGGVTIVNTVGDFELTFKLGKPMHLSSELNIFELMEYFVNRTDAYAMQHPRGYRKEDKAITYDLLQSHLDHEITIGVYQLNNIGEVNWICIDLDSHDSSEVLQTSKNALELTERLESLEIPYVIEHSGSPNSYHFWLFLEHCDVSKAHMFGQILTTGLNCEVYPKQTHFNPEKPYGNLVKLPCGLNRKNSGVSKILHISGDIHTIDLSDFNCEEIVEYASDDEVLSESFKINPHCSYETLPLNIRPCLLACMNGDVNMVGTGGHNLRCALVPELKQCFGFTVEQIVNVYKLQGDFDRATSISQVKSVYNYNRYSCERIQSESSNLIKEYCKECKLK